MISALIMAALPAAIVGAYLAGWRIATAHYLQARMMETVCSRCGRGGERDLCLGPPYGPDPTPQWIPRGAYRGRTTHDVHVAMCKALAWPVLALYAVVRMVCLAFTRRVSAATPPTLPELERRIREQNAAIDRAMEDL